MLIKHTKQRVEDEQNDENASLVISTNYSFKVAEQIAVSATVRTKNPTPQMQKLMQRIEKILLSAVFKAEHPTQEDLPITIEGPDGMSVDTTTGELREVAGRN